MMKVGFMFASNKIRYTIRRQGGAVETIALPFPQRPALGRRDKLLKVEVLGDCPLFRPDGRWRCPVVYLKEPKLR